MGTADRKPTRWELAKARQEAARERRANRERLGHEAPGTVLRGPPISVTCNCGEKRDLAYGEQWTCASCGRIWDTNQIPKEDYEAIRRTQLRFRVLPVFLGLLTLGAAIFFTIGGNAFSMFLLLPTMLILWFMIIRPLHRRAYRRAIANLPSWELHPQEPAAA